MRGHFILKILSCPQHILALLSFGAMRKSVFHHDETREKRKILLLPGQLIAMPLSAHRDEKQQNYGRTGQPNVSDA